METLARVVERRGGRLKLACGRQSPCGGACLCAFRLFRPPAARGLELERSEAPVDAEPGDTLLLAMDGRALIAGALASYLPPLLGTVSGAVLARWITPAGEAAAALLAVGGFGLGMLASRRLLRRWQPRLRARRLAP
ncbi:MAG TPA: SoxR reducing system RseC family protein [Steroidobacteraceae bacterium]|nr:SoxR reducing system RseC family protein [Steroidobacteraceae bacterium]